MPRKRILTWQDGTANRPGRWRKKFRKKSYYFPGGSGVSDRAAYDRAVVAWEKLKAELDPTAPKPHQVAYDATIRQWEEVLECSRECDDTEMEEVATAKLADLRRRLAGKRPQPIRPEDTLNGYIDSYRPRVGHAAIQEDILQAINEGPGKWEIQVTKSNPPAAAPGPWQAVVPGPEPIEVGGGFEEGVLMKDDTDPRSPKKGGSVKGFLTEMEVHTLDPVGIFAQDASQDSMREVWRDRLSSRRRRAAVPEDKMVKAYTAKFLAEKEADAAAGELSAYRAETLRVDLHYFLDGFGPSRPVTDITSEVLVAYRARLLSEVEKNGYSNTWAHSRFSSLKTFVRWLWHMDALESLPRVLDRTALRISKGTPSVITYTTEEIHVLLKQASDRTRLYILLMLNCGMTQKDISDLRPDEVDWDRGRITRKRSKTKKHRNAPEVSYVLWKETIALLRKERSTGDSSRILLNENGQPLRQDTRGGDGKFKKTDNVRNAFERLRKKTGIAKTLKSFKKTSASLIRDTRDFSSVERVFLGHAPTSMSDKHYTHVPQNRLDEAINWLHDELQIEGALSASKRPPITAGASPRKTHRRRCQPRQKHRRHNK